MEGEEARVPKTNQRLCLPVVLVRATGLWFSLFSGLHTSQLMCPMLKLVLTANGFIKSPRLTFHPVPRPSLPPKVNVNFKIMLQNVPKP